MGCVIDLSLLMRKEKLLRESIREQLESEITTIDKHAIENYELDDDISSVTPDYYGDVLKMAYEHNEFALDELKLEDGTQVLDLDKIRIELGNINHEELAEKLRVKDDYNYGVGQSYGAWYIAMAKDPNSSSNQ